MDVGAEIEGLRRDIEACRRAAMPAVQDPKVGGPGPVQRTCECSKGKDDEKVRTLCKPSRGKEAPKIAGYHDRCVPQTKKPVGKSPQRKQFERRQQFETDGSRINVEIRSNKDLSKAEVKCLRSRSRSTERTKSQHDQAHPTRQKVCCEKEVGTQRPASPKQKISWGNILKVQNGETTGTTGVVNHADHRARRSDAVDYNILYGRPRSCDDNWATSVNRYNNYYGGGGGGGGINTRDTSVQCSDSPNIQPPLYSSRTDRSTAFSSCDPLRTLQFLMEEFRSKANTKCEPEMRNIVVDMENALQRLSREPSAANTGGGVKLSPTEGTTKLQSAALSEESAPSKSQPSSNRSEKRYRSNSNVSRLEESYQALVKTCQEAEVRCTRLVEEREKQLRELAEKNILLEQCTKREYEYECKLAETLRANKTLEAKNIQFTKSISDLTDVLAKLQDENKAVGCLREAHGKLKAKIEELSQDNYRLDTENQLLNLEHEKNRILLQIKDQEIIKLKTDIQTIGSMVSEELRTRFRTLRLSSSSSVVDSADLGLSLTSDESALVSAIDLGRRQQSVDNNNDDDNLICSSPNSSDCNTPSPSKSWVRLSQIPSERVMSQLGKSAEVILAERKMRHRRKEAGGRPQTGGTTAQGRNDDGAGRLECIEALRSRLRGFLEDMRNPLRLGTECLRNEASSEPPGEDRQSSSYSSLGSTSSLDFHTGGGGGTNDPWAGSHTDSDSSVINLSKFKG